MNENHGRAGNLVETTDCLEAVGVFRAWKNFLFSVVLAGLLIVQGVFWLVNTGLVPVSTPSVGHSNPTATGDAKSIEATEPELAQSGHRPRLLRNVKFEHLAHTLAISNSALVITATLYCLATFLSLQMSIVARLGGMHHISVALFLSLVMLLLLIPWQKIFGPTVVGALYRPDELATWFSSWHRGIMNTVFYYLRFCGYWAIIVCLLVLSQYRSRRWHKAVVRRLEII